MPIFQLCNGHVVATYVQSAIRKAQSIPGVPKLTAAQEEALACVDSLTADPSIHLGMEFRPGDIQILCNHWTFHSRTSYVDWPEPARRRHLLRLWLACEDGPALPRNFTEVMQGATSNRRPNGICIPGVPLSAPFGALLSELPVNSASPMIGARSLLTFMPAQMRMAWRSASAGTAQLRSRDFPRRWRARPATASASRPAPRSSHRRL